MNRRSLIIKAGGLLALGGASALGWRAATGSMETYARYSASLRRALPTDPTLRDLIGYATLAPNAHNTQPWRFVISGNTIGILPDHARATPVVDPDDHHLFVSLGCAIETLRVAAEATGRPGEIDVEGSGVARYAFTQGASRADPLFGAIPKRQSTRAEFDGRPVGPADLDALARAATVSGVALVLVTERPRVSQIRDLIVAGNEVQMADPAFLAELKHWLRFNPKQAMETGDGLFSATSGNPILPRALGGPAFDFFFKPASENQKYARQIDSAAGLAIFIADQADRAHWVAVGRACQRFALAAASLGLRSSFVNQAVEVASLRPQLANLVGASGKRPDLVMRFGYGPELPFAPRRPIDAVLT